MRSAGCARLPLRSSVFQRTIVARGPASGDPLDYDACPPIGDFRKDWAKACAAAGVPDRLVHDLRRTAARDFRRGGVSEGEIMRLCGWKTRHMFDRYNIIDQADLNRAVARRFSPGSSDNGKGRANIPAHAVDAP